MANLGLLSEMLINGRYKVVKELGRGGIGVVYLAHDKQLLSKSVVIKILLEESSEDDWLRKKFHQEAEALARVDHPGIVSILDIGEVSGKPFLVMQFVEGYTLRSLIQQGPLPLDQAIDIIRQLGQALTAVHSKGIYHRDLKPENIMIQVLDGGQQQVKVIDFGIARIENSQLGYNTTAPILVGTFAYMSPEQLMSAPISATSDIFAMGLITYEMVTGKRPISTPSVYQLIELYRSGNFPKPSELRPQLPPKIEDAILKALCFDPSQRYLQARDFGEHLVQGLGYSHINRLFVSSTNRLDLTKIETIIEKEDQATIRLQESGEFNKTCSLNDSIYDISQVDKTLNLDDIAPLEKISNTNDSTASVLSAESSLNVGDIAKVHDSLRSSFILPSRLEPIGGAVPLNSQFYIARSTDEEFQTAISRQDSIVLVKGARHIGKTSLLARGLQQSRDQSAKVILTDFQTLSPSQLKTADTLLLALAETISDQLDLAVLPNDVWNAQRSASTNFGRYMRREVLGKIPGALVWGMDEVDRLFTYDYSSEVFGLFRSWHNARSLDPDAPWQRLTLAIAYATEANLFITDMNQSPFNVGTRLILEDFSLEQLEELNYRYGSPLRTAAELNRYYNLVGGHPYLVRRGLHEMAAYKATLEVLENQAVRDDGPFGDHLRRMLALLEQDSSLCNIVRNIIKGKPCPNIESFFRLRSIGLMIGDSVSEIRPRCSLYATYLENHLA